MGRKRKLPSDYVKEFPDFEVSTSAEETLVCKFCRVTVSVNNGKGAVRIAEHMHSQRHVQLKKPRLDTDSIEECITRSRSNRQEADDIPHQFCRALCHAGVPLHQADGPLGSLFRSKCPAARTMPGSDQLYRKYLHEVNEKDIGTISRVLKERPISITVDETPEIRGRPAVAVLATFYDDDLPGRKTLMIDLQVLQQCNAVSVGMLIQASLQKVGKTLADVAVLCSDSASYMQKLHKDLQLSSPEFKALHFKDPCHLLNNVLDDGLKTDSFVVVHDFVVHFPALLKSSRELRRKFGLVCTSMGMKIKCLSTVSPSRWFSFHEALEDILDYWRAILSFLRSDDAKGKKCEKLKALVSSPDDVHDLLIKLKFLKTNSSAIKEPSGAPNLTEREKDALLATSLKTKLHRE
ncbi:hypothetical protein HPB47_023148 [Ixodes persulcatus]|uniref:Uncharacterized protein n=1 Tax=Ixodes persulcatus TaxID=34615 RepID=A0AC60Q7Q7_IXOPE|nr:hypothetical protein HPB47_023148 [Ixodes persulcatus]